VITSNKTGATSSMKIGVAGVDGADPDPAIASLLGYDPAGVQGLTQTSAAARHQADRQRHRGHQQQHGRHRRRRGRDHQRQGRRQQHPERDQATPAR
jgi:hypothetical protein